MSNAGPSSVVTESVVQSPGIDNSASHLYISGQELVNRFEPIVAALEALVPELNTISRLFNPISFDSSIPYRSHLAIFDSRLALAALCSQFLDVIKRARAVASSIFQLSDTIETSVQFLVRLRRAVGAVAESLADEDQLIRAWRDAWNILVLDIRRSRRCSWELLLYLLRGSRGSRNRPVMKTQTAKGLYRIMAPIEGSIAVVEARFGELRSFWDGWLENLLQSQGSAEGDLDVPSLPELWDVYRPMKSRIDRCIALVSLLELHEPRLRFIAVV